MEKSKWQERRKNTATTRIWAEYTKKRTTTQTLPHTNRQNVERVRYSDWPYGAQCQKMCVYTQYRFEGISICDEDFERESALSFNAIDILSEHNLNYCNYWRSVWNVRVYKAHCIVLFHLIVKFVETDSSIFWSELFGQLVTCNGWRPVRWCRGGFA